MNKPIRDPNFQVWATWVNGILSDQFQLSRQGTLSLC